MKDNWLKSNYIDRVLIPTNKMKKGQLSERLFKYLSTY